MPDALTLIVMAAGIGSRYGGLKQVEPLGPNGEIVIDYSIYDALQAGFTRVVFLIRRELEEVFQEKIGRFVALHAETIYVFQELTDLPPGFSIPPERKKPWGTAHAVLSCRYRVAGPFAVINADDFYGRGAFQAMAGFLRQAQDRDGVYAAGLAGYVLRNTLSEHGSVARGVCQVAPDGSLVKIRELVKIVKDGNDARYLDENGAWHPLSGDSPVSMNLFGFTPGFFSELEAHFPRFLTRHAADLTGAEFFLPDVVDSLVQSGKMRVSVLPVGEQWYGVTNPEDRPVVQAAIHRLVAQGVYPARLWPSALPPLAASDAGPGEGRGEGFSHP